MPNNDIRLVIEKNIPYVKGLLEEYATIRYLAPEEITNKVLRQTDGMMIRTRTACNAELLDRSEVKLIATATIGTDHIDGEYCKDHFITVVNAPGCNAPAVAQYVFASILRVINRPLASYTIGVVGLGHVGEIVARWAEAFEMRVLRCDPPRQEAEGGDSWCDLDTIAREADIITFHTPLTKDGQHPTYHLADEAFFSKCRRMPVIVNSARGAVVDTEALKAAKHAGLVSSFIIDCWEGEPAIDKELLDMAAVATPHIAGYSRQGKIRASQIALDALTTFFMMPRVTVPEPVPAPAAQAVTKAALLETFDPGQLTADLKNRPDTFEELRNNYPLRDETPEGSDFF